MRNYYYYIITLTILGVVIAIFAFAEASQPTFTMLK